MAKDDDAARRAAAEVARRAHEAKMAEIKRQEDARRAKAEADTQRRLAEQAARDKAQQIADKIAEQNRKRRGK